MECAAESGISSRKLSAVFIIQIDVSILKIQRPFSQSQHLRPENKNSPLFAHFS
jgi:hypothetical protein